MPRPSTCIERQTLAEERSPRALRSVLVWLSGSLFAFCLSATVLPTSAHADEWQLRNGGVLRGARRTLDESPTVVALDVQPGIRLKLATTRILSVVRQSADRDEYDLRAMATPDNVAGNWELSEWCRTHGLLDERDRHLRRIVEFDGNHSAAWRALGYSYVGGRWVQPNESKQEHGYIYYRGQWKLNHEAAQLEKKRQIQQAERDWLGKIRRWRADLATNRATTAWQQLTSVHDPAAIWALQQCLRQENSRKVKFLYLELLQRMDDPRAWDILLTASLADSDEEIFYRCVELISAQPPPGTVKAFVDRLRDADNRCVNRAAYALGQLGDRSVISPLIDSLATPHRVLVRPGSSQTSLQFSQVVGGGPASAGSGTSFSTQGSGPRKPEFSVVLVPNRQVHDALVRLTGVSFGYEQSRWRQWYAWYSSRPPGQESLQERAKEEPHPGKLATPLPGG